jgi:hypothetical protein
MTLSTVPIWEMDARVLGEWVTSTGALLPQGNPPLSSTSSKDAIDNDDLSKNNAIGNSLLQNLMESIDALMREQDRPTTTEPNTSTSTDDISQQQQPPPNKRQKMDELPDIPDPYRIWMGQTEGVPKQNGAVLVQLTTPALVNALSGQPGGIVDAKMTTFAQPPLTMDTMILMAASVTLGQLRQVAMGLYRAIQTRVDADFLVTTPSRIQAMLCAELTEQEFKSTRKRVYETVIEGRGRNMAGDEGDDAPVAARVVEHDIERGTFRRLQNTLT